MQNIIHRYIIKKEYYSSKAKVIKSIFKNNYRSLKKNFLKKKPLSKTPILDSKKFLFIAGLHRSGTSILHRQLKEHQEISGFSNTGAIEDEGQHLQSVFAPAYHYGGPGKFAFNSQAHLTENSVISNQENRDQLLREWGAYFDLEKSVFLEKSPPNLIRSRYFQALLPDSRFVFIVRHPMAVALATQKWTNTSLIELLLHWHVSHTIMLQDLPYIKRFVLVRYEDLVQSPQVFLNKICDLIEIQRFKPQKENLVDHNEKYFKIWQQTLEKDIDLFNTVLLSEDSPMKKFGYSFSEPYTNKQGFPSF